MAEKRILRLCRLLGDSTRLRIYEMIKSRPMGTTVREVAAEVSLHPNVARLHLAKLEKESLVSSRSLPSRSKGRPQRLYLPGNATVEISVPQRNYSLLCKLLLEIVNGDIAVHDRVHALGVELGRQLVSPASNGQDAAGTTVKALEELGFEPVLTGDKDGQIEIQTGNCIFKEMVALNPSVVCRFHHAITEGIVAEASKRHAEVAVGNYRCRQVVRVLGA